MDGTDSRPVPAASAGAGPHDGATTAGSGRLAWVDVAKGMCIVLVVLVHVTTKHLVRLDDAPAAIVADWVTVGRWLRPVRMPLFFLLSGLLAAPVLARRDAVALRRRLWRSAELYLVWLTIHTVLIDRPLRPGVETTSVVGFLRAVVLPSGNLWYLWALAAYVAAISWVRPRFRVPALIVLGVLWVAVATRWWVLEPRPRDLVQYLAWFAMGALAPALVRRAVARVTDLHALVAVGVFVLATAELRQYGAVVYPVLQVLGVGTGLAVAARLRGPAVDRVAGLGRRTLPIYVLHVPLLTVWTWVTGRLGWHGALSTDGLHWCYPLVLTAALVAASLSVERAIRRLGGRRAFEGARPRQT